MVKWFSPADLELTLRMAFSYIFTMVGVIQENENALDERVEALESESLSMWVDLNTGHLMYEKQQEV